jgi:hypothetical protein
MESQINREVLGSLIEEVAAFPPTGWTGYSARMILEYQVFEEQGLELTTDDLPLGLLYAGLSVLARDMHAYLAKHPREDAALFGEVVSLVSAEESNQFGGKAFPDYDGLPEAEVSALPTGLASEAAMGQPRVEPLGDRDVVVHEWTSKPGKRLFITFLQKFGRAFKETICGEDGPYEQFNEGLIGQAALPATIASAILTAGLSTDTFWYPLAVYLSILLIKTGLKVYCEPELSDG